MLRDLGWLKQVKLKNSSGSVINPATVEKLEELQLALQNIYSAVDDLELTTENIKVEAGQINLNTDDLETKIQSVRDQLDVLLSTRASESTLADVKTVLDNIKTVLDTVDSTLDVALSTRASENTLVQIRDYIDTVETILTNIYNQLDVALSTRLSDSNFDAKVGEVQASPTSYTLLARLKDIWDKLAELFNNGAAKIRIWDGTTQANVTTDNKLKVVAHGRAVVSTLNSTNAPLGIGGSFVGTFEEVLDYSFISVIVKSDVDSAAIGLVVEWSSDGINMDDSDEYFIYGGQGKQYTFGTSAKYFRVKYFNNGTSAQSYFRLQTILRPFNQKPSSHRIGDQITEENDAQLVKAVLSGSDNGEFRNVKVNQQGRLEITQTPPLDNVIIQLLYDKSHTAINSGEWQDVLDFTVPTGYDLGVVSFEAQSQFANEAARAIYKNMLGTFDCLTDTFTDGNTIIAPRFATRLYAYVTSVMGSKDDIFTITYTNTLGVTGRTATVTIPKSSLVGTNVEAILQVGDIGISDITNITHTETGQAGAVQFCGCIELFYLALKDSNTQYNTLSTVQGVGVYEGEQLFLQYLAGTKSAYVRRLNLVALLMPK